MVIGAPLESRGCSKAAGAGSSSGTSLETEDRLDLLLLLEKIDSQSLSS